MLFNSTDVVKNIVDYLDRIYAEFHRLGQRSVNDGVDVLERSTVSCPTRDYAGPDWVPVE
jgi:hypothetical protein